MQYTNAKTIAAAVMLVLASVAVGGAAALTVDTETTDTAETSDLTDSSVITDPHNDTKEQRIQVIGDSSTNNSALANPETAFTLRFAVNDTNHRDDGETLYETDENWTVSALTGAPDHYHLNVSNSQFGNELTYGSGQNVTIDARVIFNETETDESVTNITFTVDPNTTNARLDVDANEAQTANNSVAVFGQSLPLVSSDGPGAAKFNDTIGVQSNTEQIVVDIDGQNASDSFAEAASSSGFTPFAYGAVNGENLAYFGQSADASWLDTNEAYVTVSSDGTTLRYHNVNETYGSSTTSVDFSATGNEAYGFFNTYSMLRDYDAGRLSAIQSSSGAIDTNRDPFEE